MLDRRLLHSRFARGIALITALGLVARLVYVFAVRRDDALWGDALFYHDGANLLVDGKGFIAPLQYAFYDARVEAADHPPLYLLYLAVASAFGFDTPLAHLVWSALLGTGTIIVVGFVGRRVGGPERGDRVGLIAAALAAVAPNVWAFDGALISETAAIFVATLALLLAYRAWEHPTMGRCCALGLACGAAALTRSELILLAPALLAPVVLRAGTMPPRERLRRLGAAIAVAALVISPWIAYNLSRFEHPVFLSSQLEATVAGANCDDTYSGNSLGLTTPTCLDGLDVNADQSVTARVLRTRTRQFVGEHLERVPVVVAARIGRVLGLYRPDQQVDVDVFLERRERPLAIAGLVSWYLVAPVAIAGAAILRRRRSVPVFPLLVVPAITFVTVALTYGTNRFRASAETSLVVLAAIALDTGWERWARRRAGHELREAP